MRPSTLLEFKTAAVLIDAGGFNITSAKDHLFDYLDKFFERRTDLNKTFYSVILTHPHFDHTSYLPDLFERYRVRNYVDNGDVDNGGGFEDVKTIRQLIDERNLANPGSIIKNRVDAEDIGPNGYTTQWLQDLKLDDPKINIRFINASKDCKDENNDSLVVLVKYKNVKLLVPGDAEHDQDSGCVAAIPRMLSRFNGTNVMNVDIYVAGHHGSRNGTSEQYLQRMTPKITVISAGGRNDSRARGFGHPRTLAVEQMLSLTSRSRAQKQVYTRSEANGNPINRNINKAVYCTCWDGDIVISVSSAGILSSTVRTSVH